MKSTSLIATALVASSVVLVGVLAAGQAQSAGSGEHSEQHKKMHKGEGKGMGHGKSEGHGKGQGKGIMGRGMGQGKGRAHKGGRGSGAGEGHDTEMKHEGPEHKGNPVRHRVIRKGGGVPAPYTNVKNPVAGDAASIAAGKALYTENCASCHGKTGEGDGEAGKGLKPRVANIAFIMDKWIATDPFLFWTISEGGAPLKTAMPAFKTSMSETQRWQIVHYLRKGLK